MRPFSVDHNDPNQTGNGDIAIRGKNNQLVALVYAQTDKDTTRYYAEVIAEALWAAFAPRHTDLMVTPEQLDAWLEQNPLPNDLTNLPR